MKMRILPLSGTFLVLFAICFSVHAQELYKWVDTAGNIHYATRYERIPEQYRGQVLKGWTRKKLKQTPSSAKKSDEENNLSPVREPIQKEQIPAEKLEQEEKIPAKEPQHGKQILVKEPEQKEQIPEKKAEQEKQTPPSVSAKKVTTPDQPVQNSENKSEFSLKSPAFSDKGKIPSKYSRRGGNVSPPLTWENPPEGTNSYVLTLTEPDAPGGAFTHWVIYNIPRDKGALPEGIPRNISANGAKQTRNDFNGIGYGGPDTTGEVRRYVFRLVALDLEKIKKPQTELLEEHSLGETILTVFYP